MRPQLHVGEFPNVRPVFGNRLNKPEGGLWTSTYDEEIGSAWVQWCLAEHFHVPKNGLWKCYLLTPKRDARILTIDTNEDCEALFKEYRQQPNPDFPMAILDFKRIAEFYDGVHLTEKGQDLTRWSFPYTLYGWDCESTVWLHDVFTEKEYLGEVEFEPIW